MLPRQTRGHAAARRACNESLLDEEGLDHVLERAPLLTDRRRQAVDAHRAAVELFHDRAQQLVIQRIQSLRVNLQQVERRVGTGLIDMAGTLDLREVAYTP